MKLFPMLISALLISLFGQGTLLAFQEEMTITPTSEAAEGLDLQAVAELFKESKNMEDFEKGLNDPESGINNLDLDENDEVDYIRVVEQITDDTHLIILQVPLAENEFQDVATIEIEKSGNESYNMQLHGNEILYGANYYVQPTVVHIHTWPIITWIYRPVYRPYRSTFYFGFYPRWWRPYRPVSVTVYRTRNVRFTSRRTFAVSRTTRVVTVKKVHYQPRTSTLVKKKTVKTTRSTTTLGTGKTVTKKKGTKKIVDSKTGKTKTVKGNVKKTTTSSTGKTVTTRKTGKKISSSNKGVKKARTKTTKRKRKKISKKKSKKTKK